MFVVWSHQHLEKLAHFNGVLPRGQHFIVVRLPVGLSYEVVTKDSLENWTKVSAARAFGAAWLDEARSTVLFVPSYVARMERNVLINPAHPEFGRIDPGLEEPVWWDDRLLRR